MSRELIPFITCGDPDLETTKRQIVKAVEDGAEMLVLGIPFSDPTAEGPVIQEANIRALAGGITTDLIFAFLRNIRAEVTIPMVFKTYANVIFSYGAERFMESCSEVGIVGILLPDLPFEEKEEFQPLCSKYEVLLISQVAPAPEERIARIARAAEGFVCIVVPENEKTAKGDMGELSVTVRIVRENTHIPCVLCCESITNVSEDFHEVGDAVIMQIP